jgi:hypothetical protein
MSNKATARWSEAEKLSSQLYQHAAHELEDEGSQSAEVGSGMAECHAYLLSHCPSSSVNG